jgi:CheY-like chemotaxis protein
MGGTDSQPILLIEDEPNDVLLVQRAFTKARIANPLLVLADGERAIEYLTQLVPPAPGTVRPAAPVLALMDLKMPRKSGFEVLEWLRNQPVLRRLPVVVLTSSAQDPDICRAYDLGANSYLVKPVTLEALVQMVDALGLYWLIHNTRPPI